MSATRTRALAVAAALLAGAGLLACSDDDDDAGGDAPVTTTPSSSSGGDAVAPTTSSADGTDAGDTPGTAEGTAAFCSGAMQRLAEYNGQENAIDQAGTEWPELRAALLDTREESDQLYGEAIEAAPDEIRSQLETLQQFSADTLAAAEEAESLEAFAEVLQDIPEEVLGATTELNTYLEEHCGFGLSRG